MKTSFLIPLLCSSILAADNAYLPMNRSSLHTRRKQPSQLDARNSPPVCGKMTLYNTGLGSCGTVNNDGEFVVALADVHQSAAMCGHQVMLTHMITGQSLTATVVDTCPVCVSVSGEGNVVADLSPALFSALGGGDGVFQGCWVLL